MKVWIDQDECTGSEHCIRLAPKVFLMKDGKAFVQENGQVVGEGPDALATVPGDLTDAVIEAAEKCEGQCIFVEID